LPDPRQYLGAFPRSVRAFAGRSFDLGAAYRLGDFSGVALWLPPGTLPDEEALTDLIRRSVADHLQDAMFTMFEQMSGFHPREPHWHLPLIGVDPKEQAKGYGSALLIGVLGKEKVPRTDNSVARHGGRRLRLPQNELITGDSPSAIRRAIVCEW